MPDRPITMSVGNARVPSLCGLPRGRLTHALDRVLVARLGLVVAPAGSGKTTLLAEWARTAQADVAWCRATREDTGETLIQRIGSAWGLTSDRAAGVHDLLDVLHEQAERVRLLVIDDVHVLGEPSARAGVEALVRDAPRTTCVLLASRVTPDLDLVHSEVSVNPVLVGREDLRFRSWEVESLFRDVYDAPLSPDEAAALARHTGGWAAALHLFHLSTLGQTPAARHRAIHALAGRNRYARGYLSQQVLLGLGPTRSTFMRHTAVFEVLTAPRCDALLTRADSQAVLEDLVGRHALTTTEDDGATFRYHEVLRRHLEADLEAELGADGLLRWCRDAAELLEADGALVEALRVRARARDWSGVRALLVRSGLELTDQGHTWTGLVPDAMLADDPWIALAQARRLLGEGQLAEAARTARVAQAGLSDPRADEQVREVLAVTRAWERLECPPTRRWHEQVAQGLRQLRPHVPESTLSEPGEQEVLARPFLAVLHGDLVSARLGVMVASRLVDPHSPTALALGLVEALAALLIRDPAAAELAEAVAAQSDLDESGWFTRASRALLAAVDPDQERGLRDLDALVATCEAGSDMWGATWAIVLTALVGLHRPDGVYHVDHARARLEQLGAHVPAVWLQALAARACSTADPAQTETRAQHAAQRAVEVGCPGAHAIATAALAHARCDPVLMRSAAAMARDAGIPTWNTWSVKVPAPPPLPPPVRVSVTVLGRFDLTVGDTALDPSPLRPQARQVLRLLAVEAGQPLHREWLADVLWPGDSGNGGMHRLHVAVSSLRRWLEDQLPAGCPALIERREESYLLSLPPGSSADLLQLRAALRRADAARRTKDVTAVCDALQAALDLYAGDLLPGDATEHVVREREALRAAMANASGTLAELLTTRDPRGAVAAAARSVTLDRYSDAAWRSLIRAHDELGEAARAQRARDSYAQVLREVGVAPRTVDRGAVGPTQTPHPRVKNPVSATATRRP